MKLEDLQAGALVRLTPGTDPVTVVSTQWSGSDVVQLVFRDSQGNLREQVVFRDDEGSMEIQEAGRPWSFDGDGGLLRLASEAYRFHLAWLFDPYVAISAAAIEPLPHQISAVYQEMMPRLPMRFLLADDPGAGKTIMAGLLIKEMLVRGDLQRCLIVAPGSLTEQWQDELHEKFGLEFELLTRDMITAARSANPFESHHRLIARMDQLSRNEELQERLKSTDEWDLVIVDEAHRMSASYSGGEVKRTKRYDLGRVIGGHCRNFLLMTATPHNGHEESFQLFLALLDGDRFEGRAGDTVHQQDPSDLMRRMVKEELVRFDGKPLFPERKSYTAEYELSNDEAFLYERVTNYVREEMNRADRIDQGDGQRRVNVGFALMTLQRRLASSPLAIFKSLQRRREKLESRLREERLLLKGQLAGQGLAKPLDGFDLDDLDEIYDDTPEEEIEQLENELVDNSTAALTIEELEVEVESLKELEAIARDVVRSSQDAKWAQLQEILEDEKMVGPNGERRKLVIFSEFRDTLTYLVQKIRNQLGREEAVVEINGGVPRDKRRELIHSFMNDPEVLVFIANDAAGEGVNLQRSHLMVNYDLPWNPNRLEQRFGRIHRIGQKEVCHLWNLVAKDTREGDVYIKLLEKMAAAADSLQGKVFDVLGQVFEEVSLRTLLQEAVVYNDKDEVRERQNRVIEGMFDPKRLQELVARRALVHDTMDASQVSAIREEMDRAQARRLQPHFIEAFFKDAFARLGGRMSPREGGRYEITRVPQALRDRDRQIGSGAPLLKRYERVCFEKNQIDQQPRAELLGLGHPLLDATIDLVLERHRDLLKRGAVLVDENDPGEETHLLFFLEHSIQDGRLDRNGQPRTVSKRMQFLEIGPAGGFRDAGPAPYIDYRPLSEEEAPLLEPTMDASWLQRDWDHEVTAWASAQLVPEHLTEIRNQRLPMLDKVEREVHARLNKEIAHWDHRAQDLREKEKAGKKTRLPAQQAADRVERLTDRLQARMAEIARERSISPQLPRLVGGALVIPGGLLRKLKGITAADPDDGADAEARRRVELLAMDAVMRAERALGRTPKDVSDTKGLGYDIRSKGPADTDPTLFIEVKGRIAGADSVTLTANEIRCANNVPETFRLAVVQVEGDTAAAPVYVSGYDFGKPGFAQTSSTYPLHSLLQYGSDPA